MAPRPTTLVPTAPDDRYGRPRWSSSPSRSGRSTSSASAGSPAVDGPGRRRAGCPFAAGVIVLAVAAVLPESSFSWHMTQHVLLGMVAPILLALGAPITLALQASSRPTTTALLRVLHGRVVVDARPIRSWDGRSSAGPSSRTTCRRCSSSRCNTLAARGRARALLADRLPVPVAAGGRRRHAAAGAVRRAAARRARGGAVPRVPRRGVAVGDHAAGAERLPVTRRPARGRRDPVGVRRAAHPWSSPPSCSRSGGRPSSENRSGSTDG